MLLTSLRKLNLMDYNLSSIDMASLIKKLTHLEDVKLVNCVLPRDAVIEILKLPNLKSLDLSSSSKCFEGDALYKYQCFQQLENTLVELNVSKCNLRPLFLKGIVCCKRLEALDISHNKVIGSNYMYLKGIQDMRSLEYLNAENTGLDMDGLREISGTENLKYLDLSRNPMIGRGLEADDGFDFGRLKDTLLELRITDSDLTAKGLGRIFEELKSLEKLQICRNSKITFKDLWDLRHKLEGRPIKIIFNNLVEYQFQY